MHTVLYVDDEPALLEVGKLFLEHGGQFRVETALSAAEALGVLGIGEFDAIISDYQMPGMDGIEFLKAVRASGNTIPFIIFTGRGREEIVIQALNEGADFYLQKGGEPRSQFAELEHKVRQAVQQRMAEASIRDHERREADIIDFLPDATFAIDTRGVVIAWNRAMEKMTGVPASDVLGKGDYVYAVPFYHELRPILIDLVLKDDPDIVSRYPYIKRDGKTLYSEITIPHFNGGRGAALWFTASPLDDTAGNIVGAIESIREITEWKRTEEALNESERRFRELADMLPQIVYEIDAKGTLTYANRIAFETFGYTEDDLRKGLNIMDVVAPADRDRALSVISDLLAGAGRIDRDSAEYLALRKDGSVFPIVVYYAPVSRQGTVIGIRGIIIDITGRRLVEDTIRKSEEKYRTVFENTGTATVLIENDGTISLANSEFERLSGYPRDEIEEKKRWMEFVVPEDLGRMMEQHRLRREHRANALIHYEFRFRRRSGETRDIYLTIDLIPGTTKSVASLLDLTERKKAEAKLIAANAEYEALLNQIQDVYYRSDAEGRLVQASRSWATLLGYDDAPECIGKSIAGDFYANPADREPFLDEVNRNGKVTDYEVLLRRKDGSTVLVSTSSHLYRDETGKVLGVEGTFRDITERKRQDHILRTQLELGLKLQELYGRDEILKACLDAAIDISGLDSGGIYLVDEKTGSVDLILSKNLGKEFMATVSHYVPGSANARIIAKGKPLYVRFSETGVPHTAVQEREGLRATAVIPVISKNRVIACLNIASHTVDDVPGESRIALETIATQIGAAIERARADEALAASEERYRNVVEDQTEFISRFLPDGTHVFVNDAYCRYFSLEREKILGHRFRPEIPPEDREPVDRFFSSLTPDRPVGTIEHRIVMPDGSVRWQRWSDRAIFDPAGRLVEYQSVGRDITGTKEAEAALRESEKRYRALLTSLNEGIWVVDPGGITTYVNERMAAMLGYSVEEMTGSPMYRFMDEQGREIAARKYPAYRDGVREEVEFEFMKKDGTLITALVRNTSLFDASGTFCGAMAAVTDITGRRQAEVRLEVSEARFATLFNTSPVPLLLTEPETGRLLAVNDAAVILFEYSREELLGRTTTGLGIWVDPGERLVQLEMFRRDGQVSGAETRIRSKSGQIRTVLFNSVAVDSGGSTAILTAISDITEQKRTEQVIREANRKISLLTSITRHDVINRITALRGFTGMAMKKNPDPGIAALLAKIDAAASAVAQQVEFTRMYQDLNMHAPGWHRVSDIVMRQHADGISLSCTCDAEIFADPMVERVFFNLAENAARHGERVTAMTVGCEPGPDRCLVITVSDNGCGVAPESKELIFEKGYGRHTGFGLFLAREVLAITGITIRETGTFGEGARFEISVPAGMYRSPGPGAPGGGD